jgi:asparaginyl-tRNA synthetase
MNRTSVADARREESIGKDVVLQGWVRTRRDSKGGFSFLEINDGSCLANVQVVAEAALANYESEIKHLTTGASVRIEGNVLKSPAKGQATEVKATKIDVYGPADATFPVQKKGATFEYLRTIAHLRPRTNTFGAMARLRNQVCQSIHQFFQENGFLYIHPPIITASDCEGAGELFKVTTLDLSKPPHASPGVADFQQDFFGKPAYLTVSGQLQAEIFACALGKVYTFGPTFRAENSNTSRHLAEFWMVEPEMAFFDLTDNMTLAEAFIKRIIADALAKCDEDMKFFAERIDKEAITRLEAILKTDFLRVSYTEAIGILEKSGEEFEFPVKWGIDLQSEHERFLTEKHFKNTVILYDYPRTLKPFYMKVNDDGKTVRAMDVLVPGVGEIIGGSQREERYDVLLERMKEQKLDPAAYWWYLDLRKYGTVPHSGFGLGLERTLLFLTGMGNIRDVIPFPRTPGNAEF